MCETSEIRAGSATPRWPQVWLAPTSLGRDLPGLQALQQQVVEREEGEGDLKRGEGIGKGD